MELSADIPAFVSYFIILYHIVGCMSIFHIIKVTSIAEGAFCKRYAAEVAYNAMKG